MVLRNNMKWYWEIIWNILVFNLKNNCFQQKLIFYLKTKIFNIKLYQLILYVSIMKNNNFIIKSLIIQVVFLKMVNFAISKMINFEYWKKHSKLMSWNNRIIIIISFLSPPSDFIVLNYYNLKSIFILWNFKFKFKSVDWLLNLSNCFKCVLA